MWLCRFDHVERRLPAVGHHVGQLPHRLGQTVVCLGAQPLHAGSELLLRLAGHAVHVHRHAPRQRVRRSVGQHASCAGRRSVQRLLGVELITRVVGHAMRLTDDVHTAHAGRTSTDVLRQALEERLRLRHAGQRFRNLRAGIGAQCADAHRAGRTLAEAHVGRLLAHCEVLFTDHRRDERSNRATVPSGLDGRRQLGQTCPGAQAASGCHASACHTADTAQHQIRNHLASGTSEVVRRIAERTVALGDLSQRAHARAFERGLLLVLCGVLGQRVRRSLRAEQLCRQRASTLQPRLATEVGATQATDELVAEAGASAVVRRSEVSRRRYDRRGRRWRSSPRRNEVSRVVESSHD